jgi:diguanylate cyclase (GGDEF)-like protein
MQKLAFYDQLTELPNRTLFYDRITQRVAQAKRDKQKLALMFLDLDDFKIINDTFGHTAGDEFLRMTARRLREGSRQADTVARLGGDEFVWFGEIDDEEAAKLIVEKELKYGPISRICSRVMDSPTASQEFVGLSGGYTRQKRLKKGTVDTTL